MATDTNNPNPISTIKRQQINSQTIQITANYKVYTKLLQDNNTGLFPLPLADILLDYNIRKLFIRSNSRLGVEFFVLFEESDGTDPLMIVPLKRSLVGLQLLPSFPEKYVSEYPTDNNLTHYSIIPSNDGSNNVVSADDIQALLDVLIMDRTSSYAVQIVQLLRHLRNPRSYMPSYNDVGKERSLVDAELLIQAEASEACFKQQQQQMGNSECLLLLEIETSYKDISNKHSISLKSKEETYESSKALYELNKNVFNHRTIVTELQNLSTSCEMKVESIIDYFPHYLGVKLHSAKLIYFSRNNDENEEKTMSLIDSVSILADRSIYIQLIEPFTLPPNSSIRFQIDFQPTYHSFEFYPANPNRGLYVPPAISTFGSSCGQLQEQQSTQRLYSSTLFVPSPLPDATMPFNVIALSCTIFALVIGMILNILVRKSSEKIRRELGIIEEEETKVDVIKNKIKNFFKSAFLSRVNKEENTVIEEEKAKSD